MEINARFGHNIWYQTELGVNAPQIYLRLALGRDPGPIPAVPEGVLLLDPLWDSLHLVGQCLDQSRGWLRSKMRGAPAPAGPYQADAIPDLLRAFRGEYLGRRPRILSPLSRGLFSDPLPPLVRTGRTVLKALARRVA
jgi:hypothetical protein